MARQTLDISKEQYLQVIAHLDNGGTKKAACEMLGIAYNTKRLQELIDTFLKRSEVEKTVRAKKRKEAVLPEEVGQWISEYLNGATLGSLSESYFRSENVIRHHLEKHGAMLRHASVDRLDPPLIPEQCIAEEFYPGQYVWSAAYNCIAVIKGKYKNAWKIQVLGGGIQEMSYQPAYDLASLEHFKALGVNLEKFTDYMKGDEVKQTLYETMVKANKREANK